MQSSTFCHDNGAFQKPQNCLMLKLIFSVKVHILTVRPYSTEQHIYCVFRHKPPYSCSCSIDCRCLINHSWPDAVLFSSGFCLPRLLWDNFAKGNWSFWANKGKKPLKKKSPSPRVQISLLLVLNIFFLPVLYHGRDERWSTSTFPALGITKSLYRSTTSGMPPCTNARPCRLHSSLCHINTFIRIYWNFLWRLSDGHTGF